MARVFEFPKGDRRAIKIGRLYAKARQALADSVRCLIEAGQELQAVKDDLAHGEWLPWLREHEEELGFSSRSTAARLLKAGKCSVNATFDDGQAVEFLRKFWGNADSELIQQSLSNEHYTPVVYVDAARAVMGGIDLDPASCAEANLVVQAAQFFDKEADGLRCDWHGRVWLNPPYGDLVGQFIAKLMAEMALGRATEAIALVNAHCTDTMWFQSLWDGALCFTDHRINFHGDDERSGSTHGSVFVYFGKDRQKFAAIFSKFGAIVARTQ